MFGQQSYLDKSMNGIKTIFDGAGAVIQNGNATFNNITVTTLTADNLSDCNLINCTAEDPTTPQSVTNKEYVDDNFVDRTNNLNQDINGVKTFLNNLNCSSALIVHNILAPSSGDNFIYTNLSAGSTIKIGNVSSTNQVEGDTTFTGTIKSHNYDTNIATNPLNIGQSNTTGEIRLGRNQTSGGKIAIGTGFSETIIYGSIKLHATTIEDGSVFKSRIIESSAPLSAHHKLFNDMGINAVLTIGNVLSSNVINGNTTIANILHLNAGSRYYSTTNYTEFLQTGTQLTIKPVSNNGSLALFSSAPVSGTQTQQLLINNSGVNATTISSTNIFSTNYNTSSQIIDFGFSITTGTCNICASITTGNVNIGNTTAGTFKTNIRGSLFSTGQATFQNFCPKSETNPAVANDLVKLSYLENNFCDLSTTQTIGGQKTFTGNTIIGSALYFTDLDDTSSLDIPNINNYDKTLYFLANNNYDNRFEFWCALNPQLSISQYSTEIKNPLIANEEATFSKQATFNSFCPKTDTNPSVANDLVKLSYLENNFCDLSTTQSIGGTKTFTGDITAQNINCNLALYFTDLGNNVSPNKPYIYMLNDVVYFDTVNNYDNYWEFVCVGNIQLAISQYTTEIKNDLIANEEATFSKQATFSEDIKHRETQIINKVKTISTTSPAAFQFPLEQTWMFTSTGSTQISVTLPELTLSSQAGFNFSFFKTASVTNSVLFTCQGTNKIRGLNSITDLTSLTRISGTGTTGGFYTAEVSTGNFVWISY